MDYVMLVAIPLFLLFIGLELLAAYKQKKIVYRLNDTLTNLNLGIGNQVFNVLSKGMILVVLTWVSNHFAIFHIPFTWWSVALCLVLFDFIYYWAHRWSHEWNIFWGAHVVHHQSEEYNLSVALRQPWFHHIISFFLFLPIPVLGFDVITIGIVAISVTLYQFWIHTEVVRHMPKWFEFIFNSPTHHRVHHAVNPKYIDKNHGAVFIVWDKIFGTYQEEEEAEVYGTTSQYKSMNPVHANFEYYFHVLKSMKDMSWKNRFKMIFAAPGWTPNGPSPREQVEKTDLRRSKYNPSLPIGLQIYAVLQFAFILWGTVAYMSNYEALIWQHKLYFAALIILSLAVCGGILEKKRWVFFAEYARLLMVAVSINALYYFEYMQWFYIVLALTLIGLALCYIWFSISLNKNFELVVKS